MKVTVEIAQEINRLYQLGNNMRVVADKLDLCSSTVCKYIWVPRERGTKMIAISKLSSERKNGCDE